MSLRNRDKVFPYKRNDTAVYKKLLALKTTEQFSPENREVISYIRRGGFL